MPRGCGWAVSSLPGGSSPPAEGESQVSTAEMWGPSCSAPPPRGMETAPRQDALSTGAGAFPGWGSRGFPRGEPPGRSQAAHSSSPTRASYPREQG